MASLRSFMIRMHYLDRLSPNYNQRRRRRYSSATSTGSNIFTDPNNNELLAPVVNPSRKRRKLSACIYRPLPSAVADDGAEHSPQLAVCVFEGLDVKIRSEQTIPVSTERFLSFGRAGVGSSDQENCTTSSMYCVPRMVPTSSTSTAYPCYDTQTGSTTVIYCTNVEFRRRYSPVAKQTVSTQHYTEASESPTFVSRAYWNVSDD